MLRGNLGRSSIVLFALIGVACTSATGDVRGGETRFDSAPPDPLVVPVTEPAFADASPTSWRGIYRDFFGRRAKASCAGNGTCHDSPDKPGSKISNFICADVDGCYTSLRTAKDPDPRVSVVSLVEDADIAAPENAYLFKVIRFRTADGTLVPNRGMPQLPRDYAYSAEEIDRMKAWIKAGAKND
jgi:hypothetical protein